ncbi:hypothetical protein N311_11107, partial [Apaloderma vittatum]
TRRRQWGPRTSRCQLCILHSCSLLAESNRPSWFTDLAKLHVSTGFCGTVSFFSADSAYK